MFDGLSISGKEVVRLFQYWELPPLQSVSIANCREVSSCGLFGAMSQFPTDLQQIKLNLTKRMATALCSLGPMLHGAVDLPCFSESEDLQPQAWLSLVGRFTRLKSLDLSYVSVIKNSGLKTLLTHLPATLELLTLDGFSGDGTVNLQNAAPPPSLILISLSHCPNLCSEAVSLIASWLGDDARGIKLVNCDTLIAEALEKQWKNLALNVFFE